jgi:hypothetical protein
VSFESATFAGQRRAEARMADSFIAYAFTWTTVSGLQEETWVAQGTTIGRFAGRSRDGDSHTRSVTIGGVERLVVEGGLHIPISAPRPEVGWEYVCDEVGPATDPELLGRRWRVVNVPIKSNGTARRLDVVEVPA